MHTGRGEAMARKKTIGELRDELKQRDRRIEELREEVDELRDLVRRMEENIGEHTDVMDRWCEGFYCVKTESGGGTWKPFWEQYGNLVSAYNELACDWNKFLPVINGRSRPVGRPIGASEAQFAQVLKLHKAGKSLRWIAE